MTINLPELDAWIAEHFMGWKPLNVGPSAWRTPDGRTVTWESTSLGDAFQPSSLPAAFALVKREIERRGWRWVSAAAFDEYPIVYAFSISDASRKSLALKQSSSEELAGCLAVKAAVEASAIPNNA